MRDRGGWIMLLGIVGLVGAAVGLVSITLENSKEREANLEILEAPGHLVAKPYPIGDSIIYEFRNSQGGTCVMALRDWTRSDPELWCMRQLPVLDYENLPRPQ